MTHVYLLSTSRGNFYCGVTSNLQRRMSEHRSGKVKSTKHLRPLRLVHVESYLYKEDAERRECFFKTTEGKRELRKQLKALIAHIHSGVVPACRQAGNGRTAEVHDPSRP